MGKATRWLKGLLGKIRSDSHSHSHSPSSSSDPPKDKKRWTLRRPTPSPSSPPAKNAAAHDATKHAIAVAAATAAAAEAAVAAAQAAADVVRLTSSGRVYPPPAYVSRCGALGAWAALVIQSHFRGYLARRALRALKGLVKLQALVRGHIMRKKAAETMRSIQAMLRAQERARSLRAYESPNSSEKSSQTYHRGPPTPEQFERISYSKNTKSTQSAMPKGSVSRSINRVIIHPDHRYLNPSWSESQFEESMWAAKRQHPQYMTTASSSGEDDYHIRSDKILDIDTGNPPKLGPKRRKNLFESIGLDLKENSMMHQTTIKRSTLEENEEVAFCTAENSPQCYSTSSRGGLSSRRQSPRTPTKSDASATSCVSTYSDCPSYMAYTESSRAKMRSLSAPRQRPQQCQERASSTNRRSVHQQRAGLSSGSSAVMQACFASKAYAGSGRLDRLGMPARSNPPVYYSGCLN